MSKRSPEASAVLTSWLLLRAVVLPALYSDFLEVLHQTFNSNIQTNNKISFKMQQQYQQTYDPLYAQSGVYLRLPESNYSHVQTTGRAHHQCEWMHDGQICSYSFAKMSDFINHLTLDHVNCPTNDEATCSWAGCARQDKPFKAKYKLVNHLRIHTGEKPFVCDTLLSGVPCGKQFARSENLKIHRRIHTGEKPFDCYHPGCSKTFSNSSDRKKHMNVHKKGVLKCPIEGCEREYCHPSSLRKHMKSLHADSAKGVKIPTRSTVEVGEKRSRDDEEEYQSTKRQKTALDCSVGSPLTSGSSSSDDEASLPAVNPFQAENILSTYAPDYYNQQFLQYFNNTNYYEQATHSPAIPMYNYSLNL